jgi:hypothetical protein
MDACLGDGVQEWMLALVTVFAYKSKLPLFSMCTSISLAFSALSAPKVAVSSTTRFLTYQGIKVRFNYEIIIKKIKRKKNNK